MPEMDDKALEGMTLYVFDDGGPMQGCEDRSGRILSLLGDSGIPVDFLVGPFPAVVCPLAFRQGLELIHQRQPPGWTGFWKDLLRHQIVSGDPPKAGPEDSLTT